MKNRTKMLTALLLAMIVVVTVIPLTDTEAASSDNRLMLDEGNGAKTWYTIDSKGTYADVIIAVLGANGHECTVSGNTITVDGKSTNTVGTGTATTDDPLNKTGTTSVTVISKWIPYTWEAATKKWAVISDLTEKYSSGCLAIGFYPDGTVPSETPDNQSVSCVGYDAKASNSQTAVISSESSSLNWAVTDWNDSYSGVYTTILTAGGYAFVKYGYQEKNIDSTAALVCSDIETGLEKWHFIYKRAYYETSNFVLIGDYVYVQSSTGDIYKINWKESKGEAVPVEHLEGIKSVTDENVKGRSYASGPTSLIYDSGAIYCMSSSGMIYCFDLNLNPIWSYQSGGKGYFSAPVVYDDLLFAGMLDGHLYVINKNTGSLITDEDVYHTTYLGQEIGSAGMPAILKKDGSYYIYIGYNNGLGMSASDYGVKLYKYDGAGNFEIILNKTTFGSASKFTVVENEDFTGAYFIGDKKLYRMGIDGTYETLNKKIATSHSYLTLVNGDTLIATSYTKGEPVYAYDLEGNVVGKYSVPEEHIQFSMTGVTVINNGYLFGNDGSAFSVGGGFDDATPVVIPDPGLAPWQVLLIVLAVIAVILVIAYAVMRFGFKWEHPVKHITDSMRTFFFGEDYSHNTLCRHRLWLVMGVGIVLTLIAAVVSLCVGPTTTLGVGEMFQCLFSAIAKGGSNLTYNELMVYSARLPRTLVAVAVGVGLSIAGAMYQAIIRNPLVDPYIMGVSSGAGTAAIAVISFDFTLFGLFPSHSIYLTAVTAAVGGILAFLCTMILATKAGGTSINYVLSGVIVGLVFSAAQTLMLTFAGNHVTSSLSWLYGSFSEITWSKVWLVFIPSFAISFGALYWAKEFNLVLLGEDQARQMGLDVKRFNRWMLIIASILTSICVAFVGIIGFVGLVIPHLCRMLLGGDHRLVLPASMAFGGFLMIVADIASRMLVPGFELPVGAITTIIGIPVFAYLLIKRGKMYDG